MSSLYNFTVSDVIGTAVGFSLFPLFLLLPGYVCGWFIDALGFRHRTVIARLAISVPLSIGISPVLAYLLWHWSVLAVWGVFGAMWLCFLGLLLHERRLCLSRPTLSKPRIAFLVIVVAWILLATFSLIDLQLKKRLYFPLVAYDYTLRTAITASITRSGIPPHNPYFFPGRPVLLRYHYFWLILCSLVSQMGRVLVTPRQAVIAGTIWCGIGLMAVIALYLRFFQPKGPQNLDRRMLIGVGLLSVAGLNVLIVTLYDVFTRNFILTSTSVVPWAGQILWVPHHVAALIACFGSFLLLWFRRNALGLGHAALKSIVAGMMLASAVGLSVYVTLVFVAFLVVWAGVTGLTREFRQVGLICATGVVTLALSLPYVFELLGGHANQTAGGGRFLEFTVRSFPATQALIAHSLPAKPWLAPMASALFLPVNYFLELGFFFLIAVIQVRRMLRTRSFLGQPEICGFTMAGTSIVVCTFLRSGVITVNDLAIRGFMVAQFLFLLWGTELLDEGLLTRSMNISGKKWLVAALVLGVVGTVNDVCVVRSLPILSDGTNIPRQKWLSSDHHLGGRTYALRGLYEDLKSKLPQSAILQHDPDRVPGDLPYGLYADRQVAAETLDCGTVFGGDPSLCGHVIGPIRDLFDKPGAVGIAGVDTVCRDLQIRALIATDTDPAWADRNGWVWKKQPLIANGYARAFLCGQTSDLNPRPSQEVRSRR